MVATETASPWADAEWAAALIALTGDTLGGVHLRSPPGPVRDYWLERVKQLSKQDPIRKIPANIPEGRLLGGIDLGATLQHGRPIAETGMLGECHGHIVIAAMAERLPRNTVHHLCTALDHGAITVARDGIEAETPARIALIATDEGTEDESAHAALIDRLGIALDMTTLGIHDVDDEIFRRRDIERAIEMLDDVTLSEEHLTALATLTASLGIDSPRPTLAAAKVARASAALRRSETVEEEDVARALRLCLIPRAQQLPEMAEPPTEPEPESEQTDDTEPHHAPEQPPPDEERLLEAADEEEEARESTQGYSSASPPRRSSSHSSPRAVVSPETGANRRYKFPRTSASSDQEDEDDDDADLGDARRDEHDERHAGFAVSPSRLHSRRGGGGIGTPNQRTRRSSGGSHASLVEEAARISRMGGSGRWSRDGFANNGGDRHSAGSASPMSPAMPPRRRRFLS